MPINYSYDNSSCHSHPHFGFFLLIPIMIFLLVKFKFHFILPIFAIIFIFFILSRPRHCYNQEIRRSKQFQIISSNNSIQPNTPINGYNGKYCKACGIELEPKSKFCSECGQKIY